MQSIESTGDRKPDFTSNKNALPSVETEQSIAFCDTHRPGGHQTTGTNPLVHANRHASWIGSYGDVHASDDVNYRVSQFLKPVYHREKQNEKLNLLRCYWEPNIDATGSLIMGYSVAGTKSISLISYSVACGNTEVLRKYTGRKSAPCNTCGLSFPVFPMPANPFGAVKENWKASDRNNVDGRKGVMQ
jgi:hypothetical protein